MKTNDAAIRVAIVGGGCAAIAAAFELTRPEQQGRYEVTIYQPGWRLGGKGRSGRGAADRIEEHGLHLWMGWYENGFRLLRECYQELGRNPQACPIADWRDAFVPASHIAVTDRSGEDSWSVWPRMFPPMEGLPGDPPGEFHRWTVRDYAVRTLRLLQGLLEGLPLGAPVRPAPDRGSPGSSPSEAVGMESARDALVGLLRYGEMATLAGMAQGVALLEMLLGSRLEDSQSIAIRFLDALGTNAKRSLDSGLAKEPELRRVWQVIDLALATLRGQIRFGLLTDPRGFDAIDEYDCREWLLLNGASRSSIESGYLRGLYDLGFGYEDGDVSKPRVAASQAVRGFLRAFFTYRGAFFWKMTAGMGDVVFAPFYEVLRRRGVRFEFFHRLTNVNLSGPASLSSGETPYVEALQFDVQANVKDGRTYEPLVDVQGLPCWPREPDYRQLVDGDRLRRDAWNFECHWDRRKAGTKVLRVTKDFDFVVLAVGLGVIPDVCREIVARDPRWQAMVHHVRTVATQAFQVWLKTDMAALGWEHPPVVLSGFVTPFDTWADMGHLLARESWGGDARALAYFCSALPDSLETPVVDGPGRRALHEKVRRNAVEFLNRHVGHLWPNAMEEPGRFRWDLLAVPPEGSAQAAARGEARFASQFWTANVDPSDRYTLSLPGSSKYRISPLDGTYDNLTIAGDWTDCGFNSGCVEAAVMSGRLASHAISRSPALEEIVGFDHP